MAGRDEPGVIGRRVQKLRVDKGLTQRQLAEPTYTPAYVSTLEAGRVRPSDDALRHIAGRLGVDFEELATGRPAHLGTDLRLRLTEAQRALATGAAEDAARQYAELLAEAERHGLVEEQATALLGLGECGIDTGDLTTARAHFERAEARLADAPLPARVPALRGRAVTHYLAGELRYAVTHYLAGELRYAVYLLESTLDELNRGGLHDPDALLLLYASAIGPYMDMGAHARAAQAAELALALAPQVGDPALALALAPQVGEVAVELADVLHRRGRSDEAAALLHRVLGDLSSERGAVHSAAAHRLLGIIAEDARDTEAAEEHYVRALSLLERAGAAGDLADLCRLLGDLLRRTGRTEAALDAYRTGLGHRTAPGTTTLGPAPAQPPL
ncbi:helix-turn-helix domain-containing protein [Streptomyces longwoodensis]|uniref:helix-turn-helix domain-containing protein n=1 Tax=Streptomyces longwoodensis TaxID=68231 RepID=UPI002DD9BF50|nr:tetratricopeptide repeat protein [Streptomyces longwoodensis]WRY89696.1 helix-turn-helix domain-containing protein [Streptomyces longwoodensis]